jgi:hypothetical protein
LNNPAKSEAVALPREFRVENYLKVVAPCEPTCAARCNSINRIHYQKQIGTPESILLTQ